MGKHLPPEQAESEEDPEPQEEEESYSGKAKNKKKTPKKAPKQQNSAKKKEALAKKPTPTKPAAQKKAPKQKEKAPAAENPEKQNKKKDFLPGQKYPTPDEEDGALAFYKSLYEKNPKSEMAKKYCLEYGVLEPQEALKLLKEIGKTKK